MGVAVFIFIMRKIKLSSQSPKGHISTNLPTKYNCYLIFTNMESETIILIRNNYQKMSVTHMHTRMQTCAHSSTFVKRESCKEWKRATFLIKQPKNMSYLSAHSLHTFLGHWKLLHFMHLWLKDKIDSPKSIFILGRAATTQHSFQSF